MAGIGALDSGNPDAEDDSQKAARLAARAARFNKQLVGNRHKELEEARIGERKAFEEQGLIRAGKTELGEAVDMRGSCERMCSEYEAEFREFTGEVHPLEAKDNDRRRIDHLKAVAAYTRSDAGAGHGEAAKLPSDLRTPETLVKTLDYLFSTILPSQPSPPPYSPTPRTALGYTAGFIRDRTRAIRKEFAMQSSWGQMEAIESFERIARWHILCLRELQEESGMNTDMHIDSAELGRCFTSLRQHYNDRREEQGIDMPCPNEPEFRAYMLIFDLTQKAVAISTAEVPSIILDHPNVQLAWQIRRAAQRNFDSQKEGSKQNAELGANIITSYVKLLRQGNLPYLLACLAEVRLREIRRSALRAMGRAYPRLRSEPIRRNEEGQIVERRMVLISTLAKVLGCEEQEDEESAWDDVEDLGITGEEESVAIARKFGLEVFEDGGRPVGVIINLGAYFDDNKDAPYTRRWKSITDKRQNISYSDIINAKSGVQAMGTSRTLAPTSRFRPTAPVFRPSRPIVPGPPRPLPPPTAFSFAKPPTLATQSISQSHLPPAPAANHPRAQSPPLPPFSFGALTATDPMPAITAETLAKARAAKHVPKPKPKAAPFAGFGFPQQAAGGGGQSWWEMPPVAAPSPSTAPLIFGPKKTADPTPPAPAPAVSATTASDAEVLNRPSFFSTSAVAGPSKTTTTPSPLVPIALTSPPRSLPPTTNIATPSSPRKSVPRSSLTRSTNRSLLSSESEAQRQQRAAIIPISNILIDEILSSLVDTYVVPDLKRIVKTLITMKEHKADKLKRQYIIDNWSEWVFSTMIDEFAGETAREAFMRQSAKRGRARQSVRHWRDWTREREEIREVAEQDRRDVWESLRDMGLGEDESGIMIRDEGIEGERMEERQVDMGLHEAERMKEDFYSPSTFLHTIARQIGPLLPHHPNDMQQPRFQILLSTSTDSASPPPPPAAKWLVDKISPRIDGGTWWSSEGVEYACQVKSRYDELEARNFGRLGIVLIEVPMSSALNKEKETNAADVQDRLAAIIDLGKSSSVAYSPSVIILTWQEETVEEISERLDLGEYISRFERISVMCLSQVDDLDDRFYQAVEEVIRPEIIREQLSLDMKDAISAVMPNWQKLLDSSSLMLSRDSTNSSLALSTFKKGIECLNVFGNDVQGWIRRNAGDKDADFDPVVLPTLEVPSAEDIQAVVLAIEEYLEVELFAGLQDIQLSGSNLYPASNRNQPLPIPALLSAIATFIFGEMIHLNIPFEVYGTRPFIQSRHVDFIHHISATYAGAIEDTIEILAGLNNEMSEEGEGLRESTSTSSKRRKRPAEGSISPDQGSGMKESKSAKNARLLRAIRDVEKSIEGTAGGDHIEGNVRRGAYGVHGDRAVTAL